MFIYHFLAVLLAVSSTALAQDNPKCQGLRTRRSAHSLSPEDWQRIGDVLSKLHEDGVISRFAKSHQALFEQVHGATAFFPFHRRFVLELENMGREIDPEFTVPFWDSTLDYDNPAGSPVLRRESIGGNGSGPDRCQLEGIQGDWTMDFPDRHCLRRDFNQGDSIEPWVPAEVISSYIQSDSRLSRFGEHIEYGIHGVVHLGLGGDAATRYAPNDFFFFMHHANIDRLWWLWQNSAGSMLAYDGNGPNGEATLEDPMPQTGDVDLGGGSVRSAMVIGYNGMCYTYDSVPDPPSQYPGDGNNSDNNNGNGNSNGNDSDPNREINSRKMQIFSGSSNSAGNAKEMIRIRQAFAQQDVLRDYFPRSALLGVPTREEIMVQFTNSTTGPPCECGAPRRILSYPARMSRMWIDMHGFNNTLVEQVYQEACHLIDLLNNSSYSSPY
ncbi:hypothetical protein H4217_001185 [Coemansia sp. RSA 1939]|nr:hypothetical protein H4217_001185 [Coemansia sp. RSA 1939]KAJ2616485.1 hypothetical protein EV177_001044 [Coemansia sp. RSA 1804]